MSVEAISWALNLAPVPLDGPGKRNPACKAVLIGLANHADPEGKDAFPSVRRLCRYTELSERTVRTALDRLEADGIIRPCDSAIIAAKIKRNGYRPQGWDLAMDLVRDDLDEEEIAALGGQFPGLAARVAAMRNASAATPSAETLPSPEPADQVAEPAPAGAVDNPAGDGTDDERRGVQQLHPSTDQGCNHRRPGVQSFPGRGAAVAPEPSIEPSGEPSATSPRAPGTVLPQGERAGAAAEEFFTALGPAWPLSAGQRARLAPLVAAAVAAGWDSAALARLVGANTAGVRSPYAVLAARLAPGELPPAPARPARQVRRWRPDEDGTWYAAKQAALDVTRTGPGPAGREAIRRARAEIEQARSQTRARAAP